MAAEEFALTEVSQREMPVLKVASNVIQPQPAADFGQQDCAFLLVTLALAGYGCYLARDAWNRLIHIIITEPRPAEFVVIALAVQVVAPLFPPLAFLTVWLSGRRETPCFPGTAALCVLDFLTAVVEVCAHAIG